MRRSLPSTVGIPDTMNFLPAPVPTAITVPETSNKKQQQTAVRSQLPISFHLSERSAKRTIAAPFEPENIKTIKPTDPNPCRRVLLCYGQSG